MSGSVVTEDENWMDLEEITLPNVSLDDVLKQVENLDDNQFLFTGSEESSVTVPSSGPAPPSAYTLDCALKCTRMDGISHQIASANAKAGRPMAIARREGKMAVVTCRGLLMIFDEKNSLLQQSVFSEDSLGTASCVAFSRDGKHIAIGYSKGAVKVVTVDRGKVVKIIPEAVQCSHGVLQILYLSGRRSMLLLDSGGSVYEMTIARMLLSVQEKVRCVFSGAYGEVVHIRTIPEHKLLVLLSLTKVILVSTNNGGKIFCSIPLSGPPNLPPVMDYVPDGKDFILSLGRGDKISVFHIASSRLGKRGERPVKLVKVIQSPQPLIALFSLGVDSLFCADGTEYIHLTDVPSSSSSPLPDSPDIQLVFSTSDFKGLAYGGNVSEALHCVAENVCYGSFAKSRGSVAVLGTEDVYLVSLMREQDQIEAYMTRRDYASAALYSLDLVTKKVRLRDESYRAELHSMLPFVLQALVDWTLDGLQVGQIEALKAHYKKHLDVLIRVCSGAKQMRFFYEVAYPRLEKDSLCSLLILEMFDQYVPDGLMMDPLPPPSIVLFYLNHLITEGHLERLQSVVMHIPIQSISLHEVFSACREHNLYDGIIYISNRALMDYVGPVEEMLTKVAQFSDRDSRSDIETEIGNKLILYVQHCLAGLAYPSGLLPDDCLEKVPLDIYRCITSLRGKNGIDNGERYPYLRRMLQFDAMQVINMICTCTDVPIFANDNRLQRLVELIGLICVDMKKEYILLQFLICVSHLSTNPLFSPPISTIEEAAETLVAMQTLYSETERWIVEVLKAYSQIPTQRILQLAQRSPVKPQICSYIFLVERRYIDLIKCYMADGTQLEELFSVITEIFKADLTRSESLEFTTFIRQNIENLAELSPSLTAQLCLAYFLDYLAKLPEQTHGDPPSILRHYPLLKSCFELRRELNEHSVIQVEEIDDSLFCMVFNGLINQYEKDGEEILDRILTEWLQYWLPLGAASDHCLNLVARNSAVNAQVLLLEARGLLARAFELLENKLVAVARDSTQTELYKTVDRIIDFCCSHIDLSREQGWLLSVFHNVLKIAPPTGEREEMSACLFSLTNRILDGGTEKAAELIECLCETEFFAEGTYRDHAALLNSILSVCSYESVVVEQVALCQDVDNAVLLEELARQTSGRSPLMGQCIKCGETLDAAIYAFSCGHVLHMVCDTDNTRECPCENAEWKRRKVKQPRLLREERRKVEKRDIFSGWDSRSTLTPQGIE